MKHFQDIVDFLNAHPEKWTAPYGILEGSGVSKAGRKYRTITFGVARYLDAYLMYFGPKYIIVKAEGALAYRVDGQYSSMEDLKKALSE